MKAKIIGTGSFLPDKILSNADLEKMVDTTDEWITTRTGMKERRIASDKEHTSTMGYLAALKALEMAQLDPIHVDLILFATITPDYVFPSSACLVQTMLKATNAAAFDLQAACTGYLYAISIAKAYIESGLYKNVLVIASEKLSSIVNYEDRSTSILFGDGASSCVISTQGDGLEIDHVTLGASGEQADLLKMPAGGSRLPATFETVQNKQHFLTMDGKEVFKHAVRRMEQACLNSLEKAGLKEEDVEYLIPHQANMRIIEALAKRFNLPMERVYVTIHKYGNTSASSLGIALDEFNRLKSLKKEQHLVLTAFGAGLTWGACVLTQK
ncbi:MAG: ketoacyl-ACP synthase III [Chlamydiae bacterium]|nr:ketoacyl-ACP synthase III [Chlamydiota bacterium]